MRSVSMGKIRPFLVAILIVLFAVGCGGGGTVTQNPPPPAPVPDFSLTLNGPTPSVQVQGSAQQVGIIISGTNGFNTSVAVTLSGLPVGVTAQALGATTALPGSSVGFNIAASSSAAVGGIALTATGTSGSLSHSISVPVTITAGSRFQLTVTPSTVSLQPGQQIPLTFSLSVSSGTTPNYNLAATGNTGLDQGQVFIGPPTNLPSPSNPIMNIAQATPDAVPLSPTIVTFTATENGTGQTSSANVTVSVTPSFGANASSSRTTFASSNEGVFGAVYDPTPKLVFAAAENINSVLAFSSTDGHLVASIPVPQPYSVDETNDGSSIYVGTASAFVYRIDPNLMQVVQQFAGPAPLTVGGVLFPETVASLSNGKLISLASDGNAGTNHVTLFDPVAQTWTNLDQLVPFAGGYAMSRSYDRSTVVITTSSGAVIAYDANSNTFSTPLPNQSGFPGGVAVSPDGSRIAIFAQQQVTYYDRHLQPQSHFTENGGVNSVIFSRDGQFIYVAGGNGNSILSVRIAADYSLKGNVANLGDVLGLTPTIFDSDETGMVFEAIFQGGQGLGMVDSTTAGVVSLPMPIFRNNNTMVPETGTLSTPLATAVNGAGFVAGAQVFFGAAPASPQARAGSNVSVTSGTVIQVTPPVGTAAGPVNVTVVEPGGDVLVEPQAYSYGPQVGFIFPNAGPASGGAPSLLTGFGLGSPSGTTQIKIGGATATNTTTPQGGGALFGPFNMGTFQISTPAGSPGVADVTATLPEGTAVVRNGYQYLSEAKVFPVSGALGQVIYDRPRQRLYATNFSNNRVEVFSLQSETFGTPISVGKNPEGLALSPDGTRLAVANAGDGTVSIIDPAQSTVLATVQMFSPAELNPVGTCGAEPLEVTAIIPHRVIIQFDCGSANGNELGGARLLNLDTHSTDCTAFPTCNSSLNQIFVHTDPVFFASTSDGTKTVAGSAAIIGLFDLTANTFSTAKGAGGTQFFDLAINDDANVLLESFGIFNTQVQNVGSISDYAFLGTALKRVNNFENSELNPSGSLYYVPFPSGIDIFDVHHGHLILEVSSVEPILGSFQTMAIDETGSKLFVISKSGITIEQLSQMPLSIGSLTPSSGSMNGGTSVVIRGSGFMNGATVTFGTTNMTTTFVDASTLQVTTPALAAGPVRITITNPDGRSYQLDAAFRAQ